MSRVIALLGALDTKGEEYGFVRDCLHASGFETLLIDVGVLGEPTIEPDLSREAIARAAGVTLAQLIEAADRGKAVACMSHGARILVKRLYEEGRFHAILALGGTGGTSLATSVMRELPLGLPKVMVSTVASGDVSAYVGVKDIVMIPSIVDVSGINRISRGVLARAAAAAGAMAATEPPAGEDKPVIVASMFGNTTKAIERAKQQLEQRGYEVIVFHCTGTGGKTMESLVETGQVAGVLDLTTTEWADECVGGVFTAGSDRLGAAARRGVPAVVAPGCLDMVNFHEPQTVPHAFNNRLFYQHNAQVTLMRTTPQENREIGRRIAGQLNASTGPIKVLFPLRGLSVISEAGGPFHDTEADEALFTTLKQQLREDIPVIEMDLRINDEAFADRCVTELLAMLEHRQ